MLILGYILCFGMGVTLGLIGAGGSILIFPILVYFFFINPVLATSYSLIAVAITALIGSIQNYRTQSLNIKLGLIFSIPIILSTYLTRRYLLPFIPEQILLNNIIIFKDTFILFLFVFLMILASFIMLKSKVNSSEIIEIKNNKLLSNNLLVIAGVFIGLFTGLVGAGGGFLIIPALVVFFKLNMRIAIGTSLFIIFLKSAIGVIGDIQVGININYKLIILILLFTGVGVLLGSKLKQILDSEILKKIFGIIILIIAVIIVFIELS